MNFRSYTDLTRALVAGIHRVPRDVDLIVAVPRSGVIPASMLALHLNLPVTDLKGFLENRVWGTGSTRGCRYQVERVSDCRHALIVDDSVYSGDTLARTREQVEAARLPLKVSYAAAYVTKASRSKVDLWFEQLEYPRVFQWNLMHHHALDTACVDIDGVLCHDPGSDENDDGQNYLRFLQNARPLHTPTWRIRHLVTSRLEKYRSHTEAWLNAQGIKFERLSMLNLPDAETRRRLGAHATFKAKVYTADEESRIFIESERQQAVDIARLSGKPVICMADHVLYQPDSLSVSSLRQHSIQARRGIQWFFRAGFRRLKMKLGQPV